MVKICHIISGDLWAGVEVMAHSLLKGLKKHLDLELSVILLNEGRLADEMSRMGIAVDIIDEKRSSFYQIFNDVKKIIQKRRPTIIHSHRYKENILAYLVSRAIKETQLIETHHLLPDLTEDMKGPKISFLSWINIILLSRYFRYIVAVSGYIKEGLENDYKISKDKIRMIHNGIEIPRDIPDRRSSDTFIIGSAGRLVMQKDYPFMIEVAREVLKNTDKIRFELIGSGVEEGKIKALINKYNMEKEFLLRGTMNKVSDFYSGLSVYINTSLYEGLPLSVLEAMAYAVPVIAPSVSGLKETIEDGKQGYLISSHSAKDFAQRCLLLHEDRVLRNNMGLAARDKVIKEFSSERMVQQYYNLYVGLINER